MYRSVIIFGKLATMTNAIGTIALDENELEELRLAKQLLENPGIAIKITNMIGKPIDMGLDKLPKSWNKKIGLVTKEALLKAAETAVYTIKDRPGKSPSKTLHKVGAAVSGGVGGFFGFSALAIELPLTTTMMLRSIAEIARSQGETLTNMQTKLACLEVFALGGRSVADDGSETGYYMVRSFLAKSLSETASFIANQGMVDEGAPILLKLITKITERFGIQVSEKFAAQSIPIIGAVGGAVINTIFINHFQDMATGHFTVRKLERKYGKETVEKHYKRITTQDEPPIDSKG